MIFNGFQFISDPNSDEYFENLGKSFDSAFGESRNKIAIGTSAREPVAPGPGRFLYYFASTQSEFTKNLRASAKARGNFGLGKGSAKAEAKQFFSSNSYSCYLVGSISLLRPKYFLDLEKVEVPAEVMELIETGDTDKFERRLGDQIITSVTVGAELLVKVEFQTSSESNRQDIMGSLRASYGSIGGNASLAQSSTAMKISKTVSLAVFGDLPEKLPPTITVENIEQLLLDFPQSSKGRESTVYFETSAVSELNQLLMHDDLIDLNDLTERKRFVAAIDARYEQYAEVESDAAYVLANPGEFDNEVPEALEHLQICNDAKDLLSKVYEDARIHWLTTGTNGSAFNIDRLPKDYLPWSFPVYKRLEPTPPPTPAVVRRQPKPPVPRDSNQQDRGGTRA